MTYLADVAIRPTPESEFAVLQRPEEAGSRQSEKAPFFCALVEAERLIRAVADCPSLLNAVAKRSIIHENGFTKIPLIKGDSFSMRLHVWRMSQTDCWVENVHDHRFSFWSRVLAGELEHRGWRLSEVGEVYSGYRYFPGDCSARYRLDYDGEATLLPEGVTAIGRSCVYSMRAGDLHQVRAVEPNSMTLLVEDRTNLRPYARVFSRKYDRSSAEVVPRVLRADECRRLLKWALARLS